MCHFTRTVSSPLAKTCGSTISNVDSVDGSEIRLTSWGWLIDPIIYSYLHPRWLFGTTVSLDRCDHLCPFMGADDFKLTFASSLWGGFTQPFKEPWNRTVSFYLNIRHTVIPKSLVRLPRAEVLRHPIFITWFRNRRYDTAIWNVHSFLTNPVGIPMRPRHFFHKI